MEKHNYDRLLFYVRFIGEIFIFIDCAIEGSIEVNVSRSLNVIIIDFNSD